MSADIIDESELFSEEELALMAEAEAARAAVPAKDLGAQVQDLQEQIQGLAAFIGEGVRREEELRSKVHDLRIQLSRARSAGEIAVTMSALETHLGELATHAARAQDQERNIRGLLSRIRDRLPEVITPGN